MLTVKPTATINRIIARLKPTNIWLVMVEKSGKNVNKSMGIPLSS